MHLMLTAKKIHPLYTVYTSYNAQHCVSDTDQRGIPLTTDLVPFNFAVFRALLTGEAFTKTA